MAKDLKLLNIAGETYSIIAFNADNADNANTAETLRFGNEFARVNIGSNHVITFEYKDGSTWKTATLGSPVSGVASSAEYANRSGESVTTRYMLPYYMDSDTWGSISDGNMAFISYSSASTNKGYLSLQGGKQAWIANADFATTASACSGLSAQATSDAGGRTISTTYGASLDVNGNDIRLKNADGGPISAITVPYANKAAQDADGNNISTTYAPKSLAVYQLTIDGRTISYKSGTNTTLGSVTVPGTSVVFNQIGSDPDTLYCL